MTTMRQKAIDFVNNMSDEELDRLLVCGHDTNSHKWVEVYPNGDVNETEEADNNTTHWIDYPKKQVACIFNICYESAESCNCPVCRLYNDFETLNHNAFYELYSEKDWDYCNEHSRFDSIIDSEHDEGNYSESIREQMLEAISEIEYGYFNDEL